MAYNEKGSKSKHVSMEIVADGTQANENPAAWYRGLGCITSGNTSGLLLDYKALHPKEYEEIMRLLFQKDYGVCLRHIKIELGSDVNSSAGTEPAVKRSAEEPTDVTRGAGFQFAADAKAINPDITLDLLRWSEPAWVTRAFSFSQQQGFEARYSWFRDTLLEAYHVYGLKFDFISADVNGTDSADETWILYLRGRLDMEQNTPYDFQKIRIVASDEMGTRNIAAQMVENFKLRNAVDVIALHHNTYGDSYTNLLNEAYGKEIWYSEGIAPCNMSQLTVQADGCGISGKDGAIDIANRIINSYYNGKMCMYEFLPAVAAYYDGSNNMPGHLISANEPWSGKFTLDSGFWMAMHMGRFSPKGWMYVNGACYGDGEENHYITNTSNNFMTLVSPDRSEMTMHFTNEDSEPRIYSILVKDMAFDNKVLSTVITTGPEPGQRYDANWFVRGKAIRPSHRAGETYLIKVPPQSIMTVTTLDTEWVAGVQTFSRNVPKSERLALPYADNFNYRPDEIMVRGCAPRYTADNGGAFELVHSDQDGNIVCQRITKGNVPDNWRYKNTPEPVTSLGDDRWRSYSAEVDVRLDNLNPDNYAGLGIRYNSAVSCELSSRCGYSAVIYGSGVWKLMDMDSVAAEGRMKRIPGREWHRLKLLVLGDSILFFIDGNMISSYRPQCIVNSGRVSLLSAYEMNTFKDLVVAPMPILPLYARRCDCFAEGVFYNEFWEVCTSEKYTFYNGTSMKALPGAAFSCKFTGTGIAVIGVAEDAIFNVTIDGETVYDEHFVSYCGARQACFVIEQLSPGEHMMVVNISSGEFKLDVLEIPENHVMMPDILTVTPAALAAAEKREEELHQQRLARQQAAQEATRTIEQAVESLSYESAYDDESATEDVSDDPEESAETVSASEFVSDAVQAEEKAEETQKEETVSEETTQSDEVIPEFASLITPALNEKEAAKEEAASNGAENADHENVSDIAAETVDTHETTAAEIYKSVTQQAAEEMVAVKPTPLPHAKETPLMPSVLLETEESPSFRPDFNIDIDI